jgi:N-acetylglucosaminyl-diphospho-decaprenol L-rhamnosyltransferase
MKKLCVVILNYRRAQLTTECLESCVDELSQHDDRCAVLVDNCSGDGSADALENVINERGWSDWVQLVRSPVNGGFAAGNNIGFRTIDAANYLLLNSDARLKPGSIDQLLAAQDEFPQAGMIGPKLVGPDDVPQISCFRYRSPVSEFMWAAGTGVLDRMLQNWDVAVGLADKPMRPPWLSFACVLIRRAVIEQVGLMDEEYFMYFEDIDYSRRVRKAGWDIVHDPRARVVHLRGGTSSVKSAISSRGRVPKYYYEARSRYFAKFYGGRPGLFMTNLCWLLGRMISGARELVGHKKPHICRREGFDNWTNWLHPRKAPTLPGGGEL